MTADLRRPVIVGTAQLRANRERTVEGAREPLHLLREVLVAAAADAGAPELLTAAHSVYAVHVASWAYDDLAGRVANAVGAPASTRKNTGLGGHLPVRLLHEAAARIADGESGIALLVGGEAQASVTLLGRAGIDPVAELGWSATPGGPPEFDLDQLGSPAMQAAQLITPTRVYPLIENRLQADLGLTPEQAHAESAAVYAALSGVAAEHPVAWNRERLTPADVGTVTAKNRIVCEPYPLSMNAMPHVDQAAALIVTSLGVARAQGIPDSALVHVWGGAGADDDPDVLARPDLGRVPALEEALTRCLDEAGIGADELDLVDAYSCFPVVPKLVARHLGLPRDAALSVTGGHSSFGGPLNSYCLHALATVAQRLRSGGGTGLVHGNGGYATYQHAVLLSSRPSERTGVGSAEPHAVREEAVRVQTPRQAAGDSDRVEVVVEAATVEHDRSGEPAQAFLVARTPDGTRVATATPAGDTAEAAVLSLASLPPGLRTHVGRTLHLHPRPDGTSTVSRTDHARGEAP